MKSHGTHRQRCYEMKLAAEVSEAKRARTHVRSQLCLWGLAHRVELIERAELLTSELVANAARHAATAAVLYLAYDDVLDIEVTDANPAPPQRRHAGPDDDGGRGLELVEMLSDAWGWHPHDGGKTVWTHLYP